MRGGLIDLFPMGSPLPIPDRPVRRRDRVHPRLRPRHPAQPLPGEGSAPAAGARVPARRSRPHRVSRAAGARCSKAIRPNRRSTRTWATACRRPASSTTCRCSSRRRATLFDYLPARRASWRSRAISTRPSGASGPIPPSATPSCAHDRERPLLPPAGLFLSDEQFFTAAKAAGARGAAARGRGRAESVLGCPARCLGRPSRRGPAGRPRSPAAEQGHARADVRRLGRPARDADAVVRRKRPAARSRWTTSPPIWPATRISRSPWPPLQSGFALPAGAARLRHRGRALRPAPRAARAAASRSRPATSIRWCATSSELKVGDPVVHSEHGIGRYQGLVTMDLGQGRSRNSCTWTTDKGSKLYVPVHQLHVISRYSGADPEIRAAAPPRLGPVGQGQAPGRAADPRHRRRAAEPVRAPRRARGLRLPARSPRTTRPSPKDFGFEETPDQKAAAIAAVIARHDLAASRWTGWSAATWASARPRWRCAPPSWPCSAASRWPCSRPPRCWPSSTSRRCPTASPNGRCASWNCRASRPRRRSTPPSSR